MFYAFLAITSLFVIALLINRAVKTSICAICVGVALTWIGLLTLHKTGRFHDPVLLGLLMGQSATGIFYWVRRRVPAVLNIFALPFLLTLTAIFYWLIKNGLVLPALGLTALTWLAAWFIFVYRNDPAKKSVADAAMDCCGEGHENLHDHGQKKGGHR